jgi:hypothetical protein
MNAAHEWLLLVDDLARRAAEGRPCAHDTLAVCLVLAGFDTHEAQRFATRLLAAATGDAGK